MSDGFVRLSPRGFETSPRIFFFFRGDVGEARNRPSTAFSILAGPVPASGAVPSPHRAGADGLRLWKNSCRGSRPTSPKNLTQKRLRWRNVADRLRLPEWVEDRRLARAFRPAIVENGAEG